MFKVLQGDPARLGPADIAGLRVSIQRARFENHLITALAGEELGYSKSLHVGVPSADGPRLKEVCEPLPILSIS